MKLYDLPWGPWPRRVTIYLKEKGITDVTIVPLRYGDQRGADMLKRNPLSYIPVLELDDGQCLVDSFAIIEYLEERYPEPNFIGRDAVERARMRAFMHLANEFFHRCMPYYANTLPQFSRAVEQSPETAMWIKPFLDRSIVNLEILADGDGPFLMGKNISIADCGLYPMVHHNRENYGDCFLTDAHPKLKRWAEHFAIRDSAACPLRDDGLRETDVVAPPVGQRFWWQKDSHTA